MQEQNVQEERTYPDLRLLLLNAPPRMSDLAWDDFRRACAARHKAHRSAWLARRKTQPWFKRLFDERGVA